MDITTEASGKRKASDDNTSSTNDASKSKRPRNDMSTSNKRKLLNGEEQRSGLIIIRGSQPPASSNSNALPQPPNKKVREAPIKKGKHKSPDEDGMVEADVRRMQIETEALRRTTHPSRDPGSDAFLPLAPRETPQIEQNRAMRGEGSRTPRRASMTSRGKRLSNSFERTGVITQPHSSVNDTSLYKHIDSELPEPDRARQLISFCAARASLPTPRLPEKGSPLFQDLKDNLLLRLAERKIDLNAARDDQPGSAANLGVEVLPNEQNVNNRARTRLFKDQIRLANAEDAAWTAVGQFYNAYQESVMREPEQRQKAKGKQRANPEDNLDVSDLPEEFHDAVNLARRVLAKDATGGHNLHSHRWSELLYKTDELHALVNTAVQITNAAESDLDRRFSHLSQLLHARTRRTAAPPTQPAPTSTSLPRRPADPSEARDVFRALAHVEAARPANQVSVAASRAAREVQRAQDAPASERRITVVAPPTPRTPRRPSTPGRGR
ncbi:Mis12-Mtw1 protein family-domain-containing protein [Lactarius quietus]|nr:Mis12-Mtw1 protein family-domain-containing protein [Lactarius quietus]